MCDMNITLSIDEHVVAEVRRLAASRGTSLNQLIRDYLVELTQTGDRRRIVDQLDALWSNSSFRSGGSWSRDELHERS